MRPQMRVGRIFQSTLNLALMERRQFGKPAVQAFANRPNDSKSIMQRHRFHASRSQISESVIRLDAEESHHLARVLRLGEGGRVFVFDGEGAEWECEITSAGKREANLAIIRQLDETVESKLKLTLAQALTKGDKFDLVVQKATELGVSQIIPLITDHSDIRKAEERAENRLHRWRRISLEALKQCGRRRLVEIVSPISFPDFCAMNSSVHNLIFSERGGITLRDAAKSLQDVNQLAVCVASEGGWSQSELQKAGASNFIAVSLGSRILRTETAAIVAVALAQHLFGDLH